jgi:hypothetical protein
MAKQKRTTQNTAHTMSQAPAPMTAAAAAAPAAVPPASAQSMSRKEMQRIAAERKRKRQTLMMAAWGAAAVVVVALLAVMYWRNQQPVVGETTFATQGNLHIALGSTAAVEYNSVPPTSGPHYENIVGWGAHVEPVRYEHLIHNLEDGGVVVYYQCPEGCPELVAELEAVLEPFWAADRNVVLAPNDPNFRIGASAPLHKDMGAQIVLTAWRKHLAMDGVDAETIRTFVERYEGIDHHRG